MAARELLYPILWDGSPIFCGNWIEIDLQIEGIPTTPYQITRSLTGSVYGPADLQKIGVGADLQTTGYRFAADGSPIPASIPISNPGFYFGRALGYFAVSAGAGSTLYLSGRR